MRPAAVFNYIFNTEPFHGVKMSDVLDLSDLLEKDEVEMIYRRELSEKEWEVIRFNLKSKFWSKVRKEMLEALEDSPDFYIEDK